MLNSAFALDLPVHLSKVRVPGGMSIGSRPMPTPLVLGLPQRRRAFAIVFTVLLSSGAGNTALQSVLPAIGRSIRVPDILVGSIFSLSALLWALATPLWARTSDRYGRKPLIVLGTIGFAVSMLGMGLQGGAGSAWWIRVAFADTGLRRLAAEPARFSAFFGSALAARRRRPTSPITPSRPGAPTPWPSWPRPAGLEPYWAPPWRRSSCCRWSGLPDRCSPFPCLAWGSWS